MRTASPCRPERRGIVLVAVLVVVVLLSLAAYQYSELMMAEAKASDNSMKAVQAKALADSGIHYVAALLSNPDNYENTLNGRPFDNAMVFADVAVQGDSAGMQGRFSIIAPDVNSTNSSLVYGVQDEAGKINLNALMKLDKTGKVLYDALMKLPNMTDTIANSIIDWLDADSEPRNGGAENDYYGALIPPYRCKNGPLDSLEELLLVQGVTPELLYGSDRNRNGIRDDGEDANGAWDRGWSAFLTIYSREQLIDAYGTPLAGVNGKDLAALYDQLAAVVGEDMTKFIILYRQYGASSTTKVSTTFYLTNALAAGDGVSVQIWDATGAVRESMTVPVHVWSAAFTSDGLLVAQGGGSKTGGGSSSSQTQTVQGSLTDLSRDTLMKKKDGSKKIGSLFDLINAKVTVPGKDKEPSVVYTSPLTDGTQQQEFLVKLFTATTAFDGTEIPARININTAPREVLLAIPGLKETDVDTILANRHEWSSDTPPEEVDLTLGWLLTKGKLKVDTLKQLEKYITARTQVYRVQAIGYFDGQGPSARVEAVIDTNAGRPRVLYWRDLTELGKGLDLPQK